MIIIIAQPDREGFIEFFREMKIISFIEELPVIEKILRHLDLWDIRNHGPGHALLVSAGVSIRAVSHSNTNWARPKGASKPSTGNPKLWVTLSGSSY